MTQQAKSTRGERMLFSVCASAFHILIGGAILRFFWAWVMPDLFGLPELTFKQAVALCAITYALWPGGYSYFQATGKVDGD